MSQVYTWEMSPGSMWEPFLWEVSGFRGHPQGVFGACILGHSMRALGLCSGMNSGSLERHSGSLVSAVEPWSYCDNAWES